jgi:tetratricopeptide (TPR) repeat protein
MIQEGLGPLHKKSIDSLKAVVNGHCAVGQYAEAQALLDTKVRLIEEAKGKQSEVLTPIFERIARSAVRAGDRKAAERWLDRAVGAHRRELEPGSSGMAIVLHNAGNLLFQCGSYARAQPLLEEASQAFQRLGAPGPRGECLNLIVRALQESGNDARAIEVAREALETIGPESDLLRSTLLNNLGRSLVETGEFAEAEQWLREAAERKDYPFPHYWLARLYKARGREGDREKQRAAWQEYLDLGGTTPERIEEAKRRLEELQTEVT